MSQHHKLNDPLTEHLARVLNSSSKAEKIMSIDTEIMEREKLTSGTQLVRFKDEFINKVKSQVGPISQEDADELEDQNFHTAYQLLREAGLCPVRRRNEEKKENASDSYIISAINAAADMFSPRTADELTNMVMGHFEDTDVNGDFPGARPSKSKVSSLVKERWDRLKKKHGLGNSEEKKENDTDKEDARFGKGAPKLKTGDHFRVIWSQSGYYKEEGTILSTNSRYPWIGRVRFDSGEVVDEINITTGTLKKI